MATTSESTTTHACRMSAGCFCGPALAGRIPEEPTQEWLYDRTDWPTTSITSLPLPPANAVAEALDDLAFGADDPSIYREARAQLAAGAPVAFDGTTHWVDDVAVHLAPEGLRWLWRWCCACRAERCWHGALCDAIELATDRLAEVRADQAALQDHTPYATLLLVCGVSLLILWFVPLPSAEQSKAGLGLLHSAVRAVIVGR